MIQGALFGSVIPTEVIEAIWDQLPCDLRTCSLCGENAGPHGCSRTFMLAERWLELHPELRTLPRVKNAFATAVRAECHRLDAQIMELNNKKEAMQRAYLPRQAG